MRKKILISIAFAFLSLAMFAQNESRYLIGLEQDDNQIIIKTNDGAYKITYYNNYIVETTFVPKGETFKEYSHAVVLKPTGADLVANTSNGRTVIVSDGITLDIKHKPFQISYSYDGKEIVSEKLGYHKTKHEPMDLVKGNIVYDSIEKISFNLTSDEVLYGAGSRALGMNRRGKRLPLYNRAHYGYQDYSELMNFTMPIVLSSQQYMIHFDNAPIGYLDLDSKKDNTLTYETISGRKTYQVIVGETWLDLLDNYTDLTGKQPIPPRWAFGNFSSRFGYHTQEETENTIAKFKEDQIPVDAVILDLYWFGKPIQGTLGNFAVYKDSFPDMEGMVAKFKQQNVKTVLITEPFVLTTSSRWKEAVDADVLAKDSLGKPHIFDFYFGNGGIIDVYDPKGEQWFWERYKEIIEMGVEGLWGDLGEPEAHPATVIHATGTADEVHNTYGHDWARLVHEGYQRDYPDTRPFILMRAGSSGSQRYGLIPWTGDVSRSWGGLAPQPEIALQMGMQGIGYMHSDLGGFAGANLDDELYNRWLQYGVFQPIYRPHANEDVPSEPVFRSEKAKALAKESIELRYQLLPYNYHLAYQNSHEGAPLMRPLFFEEPSKTQLSSLSSTYLWGHDFLVAPILKAGVKEKEVYFPATSNWFDFYTGEKVTGGQTKMIPTQENSIPTYVRAGAFILTAKPMQTTAEYDASDLVLHYFHDSDVIESEREYYNDDGKTPDAFGKGKFEMLEFEAEVEKDILEIDFEAKFGENWTPSTKKIELIVHNVDWEIQWIKVGRKKIDVEVKEGTLNIPLEWNTKKELKVKIKRK
jgi:alpha-glucosidase (family GH31 glycosyl hydrolase)